MLSPKRNMTQLCCFIDKDLNRTVTGRTTFIFLLSCHCKLSAGMLCPILNIILQERLHRTGRLERTTGYCLVKPPYSSRAPQSMLLRITSRWLFNISREEDTTTSLGNLFSFLSPSQERSSSSYLSELSVHWFLSIASCTVAWQHQAIGKETTWLPTLGTFFADAYRN